MGTGADLIVSEAEMQMTKSFISVFHQSDVLKHISVLTSTKEF